MNSNIIILIVFVIALIFIGSYANKTEKPKSKIERKFEEEADSFDSSKDLTELLSNTCYGNRKPNLTCTEGEEMICDPQIRDWRCSLPCEDNYENPFPYNFSNCGKNLQNIECRGNLYVCNNNYCQNGGILYNTSHGRCTCQEGFKGNRCEISVNKCGLGGKANDVDPSKCDTCCSSYNLLGTPKLCPSYGNSCQDSCQESPNNIINGVFDNTLTGVVKCKCPDGWGVTPQNHPNPASNKKVCIIPQDKCNVEGTVSTGSKVETDPTKSGYGLCKCKDGYIGSQCDIKYCGENGTYSVDAKGQPKCDCRNGYSGKRCHLSRSICNDKGTPQETPNDTYICICDKDDKGATLYDGEKCQCPVNTKPQDDKCSGTTSVCNEKGTWDTKEARTCKDIYKQFGDNETTQIVNWQQQCTPVLLKASDLEEGKEVSCQDNPRVFRPISTCNGKASPTKLAKCNATNNCYNLFNETDKLEFERKRSYPIPEHYDSVCICSQDQAGAEPTYECKPITDSKTCGPMPPLGFCKLGGKYVDPKCFAPLGGFAVGPRAWVCPGAIVPAEIATTIFPVKDNETGLNPTSKWYNTTGADATTIYPTINMDDCEKLMNDNGDAAAPFNQLIINEVEPAWQSLQSEPGYVVDLRNQKGQKEFISIDRIKERDKFIKFNNRIKDTTKVVDTRTNNKYSISQFMDVYNSSNDPLKDIVTSDRYKLEDANLGLTNSSTINRYVADKYNINCAVPINKTTPNP